MAADRYELLDMSKEQSLLEQIIQQAQHFFMRRRSEYVLDTIAKEVRYTGSLKIIIPHLLLAIIMISADACIRPKGQHCVNISHRYFLINVTVSLFTA